MIKNKQTIDEWTDPFPSAPEYDAKCWKIMLENRNKNECNLFWNVAQ